MSNLSNRMRTLIESINQKFVAFFESISSASNRSVVLFLFLFTATISAPMLIGYQVDNDPTRADDKDIEIFRDRAQTILDGELLQRHRENYSDPSTHQLPVHTGLDPW